MCGIAAIVSQDSNMRMVVAEMNASQSHRGPDAGGMKFLNDDGVALGHTRLSLLDCSPAGDQPMESERYVLAYNGEIYNHHELRTLFPGWEWKGGSDTEVLLRMIEHFGVERTLPQLIGMWAFAVWDKQEQVLSCATDPLGIKPLYVHKHGGLFACASTSAALLYLRPKWKLDPLGVSQFFNLGGSDGVWQGIRRIPGGTLCSVDVNGVADQRRWYYPRFREDAADVLPDLIRDAVQKCAIADVPVGLFYSGGIDSTVVAANMKPCGHATMCTCAHEHMRTAAFHLNGPELEFADQGAKHMHMDLHLVDNNAERIPVAWENIARTSGEPFMSGFIPWMVSRIAGKHRKACISANGADELFFGYDRTPARYSADCERRQLKHIFRDQDTYTPPFGVRADWHPYELTDERFSFSAHRRWFELMTYVQHDLNPTLDAASMAHGLEMRVPFLDHRVVEAALSIDSDVHGRKDILKAMLRTAGFDKAFIDRPKYGFSMAAKSPTVEAMKKEGLALMARKYGMTLAPDISGRDREYLSWCAAAFATWESVWKDKIDPATFATPSLAKRQPTSA